MRGAQVGAGSSTAGGVDPLRCCLNGTSVIRLDLNMQRHLEDRIKIYGAYNRATENYGGLYRYCLPYNMLEVAI